jgi:hypothetical protein
VSEISTEEMLRAMLAGFTITEATCLACRARNRIRNAKLREGAMARCGRCGLPIRIQLEGVARGKGR